MPETELGEVEGANEAVDRPNRIVQTDIVLDPGRKQTGLLAALAALERAIRHKPNRTCCSRKCPPFLPSLDGQISSLAVQPRLQKYFASPVGQIISTNSCHPTPPEGRIAIVTDAGRGAVDAAAFCARRDCRAGWRKACERSTACGREMLQRTAKSCGPDAPTLASSSRMFGRPNRVQAKR